MGENLSPKPQKVFSAESLFPRLLTGPSPECIPGTRLCPSCQPLPEASAACVRFTWSACPLSAWLGQPRPPGL